jgi:hypothetical protein
VASGYIITFGISARSVSSLQVLLMLSLTVLRVVIAWHGAAMALLITYVLVALVFSFLCSIAEAVLLSVTAAYVALLEKRY